MAWTGLKNLMHPPHAQGSAGGSTVAKKARWLVLALAGGLSMGGAFAATNVDLLVNQIPTPLSGPAGGTFVYKLKVSNNTAGVTANDVVLTSKLPIGATYKSLVASVGTCAGPVANAVITGSGDDVVCTLGPVVPGSTPTVDITVMLPTVKTWDNTASVTSASNTDPNTTNNTEIKGITATDAADLKVAADVSVGPYTAGLPYTYTLIATNDGPSPVPTDGKVEIAFQVPAGAAISEQPSGLGWICAPASGYPRLHTGTPATDTITCARSGGLLSGASTAAVTVTAVSNVIGSVGADFGVKGYKAGNVAMPDGNDNNTASVNIVSFDPGSDLKITKIRDNANVALGDTVTYTLTPRLLGGTPLTGATITVTDTLGANLTYVPASAQGTGWTCGVAAQVITCTRAGDAGIANYSDLPPITLKAIADVTGTLGNIGSVAYSGISGSDPVSSNDGTGNITVISSNDANLSMNKFSSINTPVSSGTAFTYTMRVTNGGPLNVLAGQVITVTDTVPAGLQVMSLNAASATAGWSCSGLPAAGADFTCSYTVPVSGVAKNAKLPDLDVTTVQTGDGTFTNTACLALTGVGRVDPTSPANSGNNCDSHTSTTSTTNADLSVTKAVSGPVFAGENLTYTMTVNNAGPATATRVRLYDTLASLVATGGLQSATVSGGGSCTPAAPANGASIDLVCDLGDMPTSTSKTVAVVVRPSIVTTGTRTNVATVTSLDINDPNRANNTSHSFDATDAAITVTARVDLVAFKTATPASVKAGEPIAFTATVKNDGPSSAAGVTLEDTLPTNAAMVGTITVSNGGVCLPPALGKISCSWATPLPSGSQYTVNYRMRPLGDQAGQNVVSRVDVATTTSEPVTTNNFATTTTPVTLPVLNVLVSITDDSVFDPLPLGDEILYTIKVRNNGPSYGTNVVMTNTFPSTNAGGDPSSATFSYQGSPMVDLGGSCIWPALGATSGSMVCTWPGLLKDEEATITFKMRADGLPAGAVSGTVFHKSVVKVDEAETDYADNQRYEGTSTSRVSIATDLGITKTGPAGPLAAGALVDYVLTVKNNGPLTSNGAQVIDDLPAGLEFVSGAGCVYAAAERRVSCAVGTLVNGASKVFNLQTRLSDPYTGARPLVNNAKVDALGDTVSGNNESSTPTNIVEPPGPPPPSDPRGSIGCSVFDDLNQNGSPDAGESGVAGITIRLLNAQNQPVTSTVTAADGSYSFVNLTPGTYTVQQDVLKGYTSTTSTTRQVTVLVNQKAAACFGVTTNAEPGSIGCSVFNDTNQDGTRDPSEKGLSGLTVRLFNDKDEEVATTTTAADGNYSFPELAPGAYKVSYVLPKGYSSTSPVERSITVLPGKKADACFGALPGKAKPGSVGCSVFDDANNNGQRDPGEGGLPNVTVRLLDADGKLLKTTTSATDGTYGFPDLAPGSYTVETDLPKGYNPTGSTSRQFTLTEGANVNACFGATGGPGVLGIVKTLYEGWNAGGACGTSVAKKELLIVEKIASEHELTWCFAVTNLGNKHLGAPVWADSEYPGMVATAKAGTTLPLAPGATGTWYFQAKHKSSVVNVVGVKMPVTDPEGKIIPGVPPASSSDDGKATFGMIYDPPYGVKVGTVDGADIINWTMVWVNDNVIAANNVYVSDTVKAPMEFVPGSLSCLGEGATSVVAGTCQYVAGTKTVSVNANFAPDLGKTVVTAKNRMFISFKVKVPKTGGSTSYENQGAASWTPPGGTDPIGSVTVFVPGLKVNPIDPKDPKVPTVLPPPGVGVNDPLLGHPDPSNPGNNVETPVLIDPNSAPPEPPKPPPPPTIASIPTLSEWGVILLSCLMGLLALGQVSLARRR